MSTIDGAYGSSTSGLLGALIASAAPAREQLDRLTARAATGKIADTFAGLDGGGAASLALRPRLIAMHGWRANIDGATTRMAIARTAMSGIQTIASDLLARLNGLNGLNKGSIDAIAAGARSALEQTADMLNSQAEGAYVFAGQDTANAPIPNAGSILTSGFYTGIAAAVGGLGTSGAGATAAATLAVAASNASGTTPFSAYLSGAPSRPLVETGPNETVAGGMLANANASAVSGGASSTGSHMRDLLRALATVGSLTSRQADDPALAGLVEDTRASLTGAIEAMAADAGVQGDAEAGLARRREALGDAEIALAARVSKVEDADMATTLSDLAAAQTRLQASYRLIAGANDLSLIKFLGPG